MYYLLIALYIIGCILSYGRYTASWYSLAESYIKVGEPVHWFHLRIEGTLVTRGTGLFYVLSSWVGFIAGIISYILQRRVNFIGVPMERYFFKWSYKMLHLRYFINVISKTNLYG